MKTLALSALLAASVLAQQKYPTLEPGATAPDFDLPGVDGKRYALKDFAKSKLLLIIFTCNHCPTSIAYEARIKKIVTDYREKGVAVVAINPNNPAGLRLDELGYTDLGDSFEEMKIRARDAKFNFPYLHDGDTEEVSKKYGPVSTPHAFLFDAERKLRYVGRIDDNEREERMKVQDLRNAIDALLEGKEPPVVKTKSTGCSTKWIDKSDSVKNFMDKLAKEPVSVELADAAAAPALLKNDSGKVRLIFVWSLASGAGAKQFAEFVTMNRMYRHRKFEFVSVSTDAPEKKDDVLAFLKKEQASNKNLTGAPAGAPLGAPPLALLVAPGGDVILKKEGAIDVLEVRRAIVKALGPR